MSYLSAFARTSRAPRSWRAFPPTRSSRRRGRLGDPAAPARADPVVPVGSAEPFYRIVQAGFRQRRKQIHNGLVRELPASREAVTDALERCGVDGERRPQTLSIEEWACLALALGSAE
jgi:hypothetical protein